MTTPTPLEQRLSAALAARTEQVQLESLGAAAAPAAESAQVLALHRRRRVATVAVVGLAAASVITVAVVASTTGDDASSPAPAAPVTVSPPLPAPPSVAPTEGVDAGTVHDWDPRGLPDPIDTADRSYLGMGVSGAFTYRGSAVSVQVDAPPLARKLDDGEGALEVSVDGVTVRASLPAGSYLLKPNAIDLAPGATGFVLASPLSYWIVYVLRDGELVRARKDVDTPPLGYNADGPGQRYESFVDDSGRLNTLTPVRDGFADADVRYRYDLVTWTVRTVSRDAIPQLTPTPRGEICVDRDAGEYGRC